MPIKDKSLYPKNWKEISNRIRFERAGGKCERCGAVHGTWIWRSYTNPTNFLTLRENSIYYDKNGEPVRLSEIDDEYLPRTDKEDNAAHDIKVVLTCAHLDHNPANNDESNLAALCQSCHLKHGGKLHAQHAAATRADKRDAATGQGRLF